MPSRSAEWDTFVNGFIDRTFEAQPHSGVYEGRHEFDGRLPDWSSQGLEAELTRLREERQRATAFDPDTLDDRQRFERDYLLASVDGALFLARVHGVAPYQPELLFGCAGPQRLRVAGIRPSA